MEFGQYLRDLRKSKGLSVREVSRRSGVSNAYISQIETGNRCVGLNVLYKLSVGLNVDHQTLVNIATNIESVDNIQ